MEAYTPTGLALCTPVMPQLSRTVSYHPAWSLLCQRAERLSLAHLCHKGISLYVLPGQVHTCGGHQLHFMASGAGLCLQKVQKLAAMGHFKITIPGLSKGKRQKA